MLLVKPTLAITKTAKKADQVQGRARAAQPMTPKSKNKVKIGFLYPLVSAIVPKTGPSTATIKVDTEMA